MLRIDRWNKYTQIASRAIRQGLGETERVAAERRAQIGV
jgi:F-type H+-transporting ATPase subunit epsilon